MTSLLQAFYDLTQTIGYANYGLAIILFTVVLRILMFPLNLMQARSTKAMSTLQPHVKRLQQQYKNDKEILNREMSALYKKYKVNPMSGCLPMLVQMPVLFALFGALRDFAYVGEGASFLWLSSMSEPDPTGIVLPIIVAVSTFLQSKLTMAMSPTSDSDQAKSMNTVMLYGMPIMLGFMARSFAAGLAIYWVTSNLVGFLMQILINASASRSGESLRAAIEADERKQLQENAEKEEQRRKKREEEQKKAAERKQAGAAKSAGKPGGKGRGQGNRSGRKGGEDNKGRELDFDDYTA